MLILRIIFNVCVILSGLISLIFFIQYEMGVYVLLSLGLMIWGGYDLSRLIPELRKKSDAKLREDEREVIKKKIEEED